MNEDPFAGLFALAFGVAFFMLFGHASGKMFRFVAMGFIAAGLLMLGGAL